MSKDKLTLVDLLERLYPSIKNDGFLLHKTMEYFGLNDIPICESDKKDHKERYDYALKWAQNSVVLNSLIETRFHTEQIENDTLNDMYQSTSTLMEDMVKIRFHVKK